jgi:hypothetical protein
MVITISGASNERIKRIDNLISLFLSSPVEVEYNYPITKNMKIASGILKLNGVNLIIYYAKCWMIARDTSPADF